MATVVGECAAVVCRLLKAVEVNEDLRCFQNSCTGLHRFDSPESNGNSPLSSTSTSKKSGGFMCCVPDCFTNNKRNLNPGAPEPRGQRGKLPPLPKQCGGSTGATGCAFDRNCTSKFVRYSQESEFITIFKQCFSNLCLIFNQL